jgi:ATP-binding cassette subfamily C (CFTR/MRP) protein 10
MPPDDVQILLVMGLLIRIMGWAATLAGLVVTVIMIPASTLIGGVINTSRKEMLKHTDARVKLSTEVVTGVCHARVKLST